MGLRANTAYVYWSRRAELAAALEDVFAAEGYVRVERGSELRSDGTTVTSSEPDGRPPTGSGRTGGGSSGADSVWALAILPGKEGWSVVKTLPVNLLCGVSAASGVPRLGELAAILRCPAFQYNVQDGAEVLVEADPSGEIRRGQSPWAVSDPLSRSRATVVEDATRVEFHLLRLPALSSILSAHSDPEARARALAEALAEPIRATADTGTGGREDDLPWTNEIQTDYLEARRALPLPGSIDLYFAELKTNESAGG